MPLDRKGRSWPDGGRLAARGEVILTLGGDTVRIVDYLIARTANQINDDILI